MNIDRRTVLGGLLGGSALLTASILSGPSRAQVPSRGGQLTVGIYPEGKSDTLDPAFTGLRQDLPRIYNHYDNLFRRGADGKAKLVALKSAEGLEGNKRWVFELRDDLTWHDGSKATADDLHHTIMSWANEKHAGHGGVKALIDFPSVKKVGPLTVEVPLLFGVREFPSTLTFMSYALVKQGVDNSKTPIGTGPFKLVNFTPGIRTTFVRFDDYWGGAPYLDELVIDTSFLDDNARVNALLSGKLNAIDRIPYPLAKIHSESSRINILNSAGPAFQAFVMHLGMAEFKDVRVRQALKLAANREMLVESALNGFGTVGNDIAGEGLDFFADDLKQAHDPDKAKFLLKEAGVSDLRLKLDMMPSDTAAVLYQQQAKSAGITIDLNTQDAGTFYSNYLEKPFSTTTWDSPLTSLTQFYLTTLQTGARFPETHWGDKETDKLLFDAIAETDDAAARQKWHEVQKLQFDQGGYIIWANANYVDGIGKNVQGIEASRAGGLGGYNFAKAWIA